jgi:hypothetical protein
MKGWYFKWEKVYMSTNYAVLIEIIGFESLAMEPTTTGPKQ